MQKPSAAAIETVRTPMSFKFLSCIAAIVLFSSGWPMTGGMAQVPPSASEITGYDGLHAAAHENDTAAIQKALALGADLKSRDDFGRTPVLVAAHASAYDALRSLVAGGADIRAMDVQRYDVVTIAAVANDIEMVALVLQLGGDPKAITSPYDGTALIAAAHLGHVAVVQTLIEAGAPLDHINNIGWTALMEAVVLGDGGRAHSDLIRLLVEAGADKSIADREGRTPLKHAQARKYAEIVLILK
jgi:ankyrin repeat protein